MAEKKLWFRAKNYGWGWTPITWQGWLVVGLYIVYIVFRAKVMGQMFDTASSAVFRFLFEIVPPTAILIIICLIKGEKPRWRWGGK